MIKFAYLLIIGLLIWFLNYSLREQPVKELVVSQVLGTEQAPDYYSENLQMRQFNKQGKLQSLIKTKRFSHYADQQFASLLEPEITLYQMDGNRNHITSQLGEIEDSSRDLTLTEKVQIVVSDNQNKQQMVINTSDLHYGVAEQILWTDSPVTAELLYGSFVSLGLQMDINTQQMMLKDKVKVHYDL
ncbi:MAG: LPS export ABC transporter periplasmic protein LptC [Gammaproteobacteria bacterium]|nr:MAG: LPS export ABC transporter periplasmic protein LptC [Gammaproteobacteria bacterium]